MTQIDRGVIGRERRGLTSEEVRVRAHSDGPNALPRVRRSARGRRRAGGRHLDAHGRERLGWRSSSLLIPAVTIEPMVSVVMIAVPWLADQLDQAPPSPAGWAVVTLAPLVVLAVDALDTHHRAGRGTASTVPSGPYAPGGRALPDR